MDFKDKLTQRSKNIYITVNEAEENEFLKFLEDNYAKNLNPPLKVYEFWFNPMIEESESSCISLHFTKEGAELALENHIADEETEFNFMYHEEIEGGGKDNIGRFDDFKAWGIRERFIFD